MANRFLSQLFVVVAAHFSREPKMVFSLIDSQLAKLRDRALCQDGRRGFDHITWRADIHELKTPCEIGERPWAVEQPPVLRSPVLNYPAFSRCCLCRNRKKCGGGGRDDPVESTRIAASGAVNFAGGEGDGCRHPSAAFQARSPRRVPGEVAPSPRSAVIPSKTEFPARRKASESMWRLAKPSESQLIEMLMALGCAPVVSLRSGDEAVQVTQDRQLGSGNAAFESAYEAMRCWQMIPPFMDVYWPERRPRAGVTIVTGMQLWGVYSLHPCRITEITDERHADGREFALTWATVRGHPLRGYETFRLTWQRSSNVVSYQIRSTAAPCDCLRIAHRSITRLREQFARESCEALQKHLRNPVAELSAPESSVSL